MEIGELFIGNQVWNPGIFNEHLPYSEHQKKREQATSLLKEELGTGRISKILLKRIAHLRKFQGTGIWELEEVVLISFFPYLIDAFLLKEEGKGVSMQILHPGIP
ncbi:hypothetical protein ACJX0J_003233, partial (mitochondrion) [Zea mays]